MRTTAVEELGLTSSQILTHIYIQFACHTSMHPVCTMHDDAHNPAAKN